MTTLKIQSAEIEQHCASPKILPFLKMRFINFFLACMVQKYQNERVPIFYYGNSPKNSKKDQKVAGLQLLDWIQPYWMTRYNRFINLLRLYVNCKGTVDTFMSVNSDKNILWVFCPVSVDKDSVSIVFIVPMPPWKTAIKRLQ